MGKSRRFCRASLLLGVLVVTGCSTLAGPPDWVRKGARIERDALYGVGAIAGVHNAPLAWEAAENRARQSLAKVLETYSATLMNDYAAAIGSVQSVSSEEQGVERALRTITIATLRGVEPVDRYYDRDTGTYHVLVRWEKDRALSVIDHLGELDERARERVRRNAERLFEELRQEEERRHGSAGTP